MSMQETFNRSGFSRFLNGPNGRVFRLVNGTVWVLAGFHYRKHALGKLAVVWGVLAMIAGAFDVCFISLALGGPFTGDEIRGTYQQEQA
jgi:hypothetical protein